MVGVAPCLPVNLCLIGFCFALSRAAAVVKNCPFPFHMSSLHINNCLRIICTPRSNRCHLKDITFHCMITSSFLITFCSVEGRGSWSDVSVLPAISLHPLPLPPSLSAVSLNQDIACPFLFFAASLPSALLFVCPRFFPSLAVFPPPFLQHDPHQPPLKEAPHEAVASQYHFPLQKGAVFLNASLFSQPTARQQARTCGREVSDEDDSWTIENSEGGMRKRLK